MPKLIPIDFTMLLKLLSRAGFAVIRIKGSHHFLKNSTTGMMTTLAVHPGMLVKKGTLKGILRDINMSVEEYERLRLEK